MNELYVTNKTTFTKRMNFILLIKLLLLKE